MSIVKLKSGKTKYIGDEIDLRNMIFEELGSDAEDEFMKLIDKVESLTINVEFLEAENKACEEEKDELEDENTELENKINDLRESLNYVKETIDLLKREYKTNEDENRKLLYAIKSLENNL